MSSTKFSELFPVKKPIIGMIHLAGRNQEDIVKRATEELKLYEEEGVDGAIIEDYHGTNEDLDFVLKTIPIEGFKIVLGINSLRRPYLSIERAHHFKARFVQFDDVQGEEDSYCTERETYSYMNVLGGARFKYTPSTGNSLEKDLEQARLRCDAIVTTGEGTGTETPTEKLKQFRELLGDFPLIVGAGVNLGNVCEQLSITDGAIVGSYFKPEGNTQLPVDRKRVRDLMDVVRKIRKEMS